MKVSMFTTMFSLGHSKFGISNAAYFLARNMAEKGDEISVCSIVSGPQKTYEKEGNISVKRFEAGMKSFLFARKMLTEPRSRPDIFHSFHYGYFPATAGFVSSIRMKSPHIFTPAFHPPIYTTGKRMLSWQYGIFQGWPLLKFSKKTLAFNKDERTRLSRYVKGNFDVVPPPVDSRTFYPDRKESGKTRIGFIGPMLPWKGALVAAEIFGKIQEERKDVEFVFIGFGELESEIRKNGRFKFHRELAPKNIASHLNSMDILVAPTKYESFGYVLAEAGICGTPVVSTRVGAVPETVGEGGVLVDYGDWKDMKEKIENLIDDSRKRKSLGKKAIKHTTQFRDGEVSEKVYKIYKSLL